MDSISLGKRGEDLATEFLERNGYKVLSRNFSWNFSNGKKMAEIDIIVQQGRGWFSSQRPVIVFVEVKTLASDCEGFSPEQKVGMVKKRKIASLAEIWLRKNNYSSETPWRIDVISITLSPVIRIEHFENIC